MSSQKDLNAFEIPEDDKEQGLEVTDGGKDEGCFVADDLMVNNDTSRAVLDPNDALNNVSMASESRDNCENKVERASVPSGNKCDPSVYIDEETRMFCNGSPEISSPRDIVSPADPGEVSSPFSAMESDGMETGFDDASLSAPGDVVGRPSGFFGASTPLEYTTTPGASSSACDDNYESSGSRKKRRKTRRDMQPAYNPTRTNASFPRFALPVSQLTPASCDAWYHDADSSPFSPPQASLPAKGPNFSFAEYALRRNSGGNGSAETQAVTNIKTEPIAEQAKRSKPSTVPSNDEELSSKPPNDSAGKPGSFSAGVNSTRRRHFTHHRGSTSTAADSDSILHKQFPRKSEAYELRILSQPETQHRARYLTEGSRGPVKDASQQGYPKIHLVGYKGSAMLQVFVATDSGKIKPHGFYQACRVTGRNTSPCEEIDIDGTKVIEIPFKSEDMILSVDCVGILKLRNTDVEARMGVRNQKRNQSVRLVFRVSLKSFSTQSESSPTILQVASVRISCTQPLGQPEITKKSIDRCSVEGGTEMFIIGKNFHRGTKVIYQDPEEPNSTQWNAEGEVDKDTFHQTHMVVRVPPYHDQSITKSVNVQLLVEYQGKKCEPHSFTYDPKHERKELVVPKKETVCVSPQVQQDSSAITMQSLLDGPIDRKILVALFSKLLSTVGTGAEGQVKEKVESMEKVQQNPDTADTMAIKEQLLNAAISENILSSEPKAENRALPELASLAGSGQASNAGEMCFPYAESTQSTVKPNDGYSMTPNLGETGLNTTANVANAYKANSNAASAIPFVTAQNLTMPSQTMPGVVQLSNDNPSVIIDRNSNKVTAPNIVRVKSESEKSVQNVWAELQSNTSMTSPINSSNLDPAATKLQRSSLMALDQLTGPMLGSDQQAGSLLAVNQQASSMLASDPPAGSMLAGNQQAGFLLTGNQQPGSTFVVSQPAASAFLQTHTKMPQLSVNVKDLGNVQGQQLQQNDMLLYSTVDTTRAAVLTLPDQSSTFNQLPQPPSQNFVKKTVIGQAGGPSMTQTVFGNASQGYTSTCLASTTVIQGGTQNQSLDSLRFQQDNQQQVVFAATNSSQQTLPCGGTSSTTTFQSPPKVCTNLAATVAGSSPTPTYQMSHQNLFQGSNEIPLQTPFSYQAEQYPKLDTEQKPLMNSTQSMHVMPSETHDLRQQILQRVEQQEAMVHHEESMSQLQRPNEVPMQVDPYHAPQNAIVMQTPQQVQVRSNHPNISPVDQMSVVSKEPLDQSMSTISQQQIATQMCDMKGSPNQQVVNTQMFHNRLSNPPADPISAGQPTMMQIPVSGEFLFPISNNMPLSPVNADISHAVLEHQPGNSGPGSLEQVTDNFAMDQLLQSIDGSENLVTISGEDVQRQFQ